VKLLGEEVREVLYPESYERRQEHGPKLNEDLYLWFCMLNLLLWTEMAGGGGRRGDNNVILMNCYVRENTFYFLINLTN